MKNATVAPAVESGEACSCKIPTIGKIRAAIREEFEAERRVVIARGEAEAPNLPLTTRDIEVLTGLVDGLTNALIAARLMISPETVKSRLDVLNGKTNTTGRVALAVWALRTGTVR